MQLLKGRPGVIQVQTFVPAASMPQVTQQSCVQGVVQLELSQPDVQAPLPRVSGFAFEQSPVEQVPGLFAQIPAPVPLLPAVPELPPCAPVVLPPVPVTFVVPPVPPALFAEEHAESAKLCASRAATPRGNQSFLS